MSSSRSERVTNLILEDLGTDPTEEGFLNRNGNDILAFVGGVARSVFDEFDPYSFLVNINESYELNYTYVDGVVSSLVAHVPGSPFDKIREVDNCTVDSDGLINGFRLRQYDQDRSTVIETFTLLNNTWTKT